MSNYKTLDAWKVSMELVREIYLLTKQFPKEELYGLTSQIRRSAVSIPTNIAEGLGRQYKKDTLQFFYVARGSIYELETLINIGLMANIISKNYFEKLLLPLERSLKLLYGLIKSYEIRTDLK
ncbi:MAG: four helix bundle protein [Chitinophagaceae bacterium]|nr:four helix bundle protein [Chitinophagaceae bacterium]